MFIITSVTRERMYTNRGETSWIKTHSIHSKNRFTHSGGWIPTYRDATLCTQGIDTYTVHRWSI